MSEVWIVLSKGRNFDDPEANDTQIMGVYGSHEPALQAMKSFMTAETDISGLTHIAIQGDNGSVAESAEGVEDENEVGIDYWISRYEVK